MFPEEIDLPINRLKGIGPAAVKDFAALNLFNLFDLISHYPVRYEDRINFCALSEAPDRPAAFLVEVTDHGYIPGKTGPTLKVTVEDASGVGFLLCFGRNFLEEKLAVGSKIFLFAGFSERYGELQSSGFDFEPYSNEPARFYKIEPVYALAGELKQNKVRGAVRQALALLPEELESPIPNVIPHKKETLTRVHFPASLGEAEESRALLIYEEAFLFCLASRLRRAEREKPVRAPSTLSRELITRALSRLPFGLTDDQRRAIEEIVVDMERERPMRRMVRGDVGSGKTLVALLSCCALFESGRQVAFMAPTELLARQHADLAESLLGPLGVRVAFLTGNARAKARGEILSRVAAGDIDLVVGTHALFTDDVKFLRLSLVVIDEQQRFGVSQRARLLDKGRHVDMLSMTATPIPRSLMQSMSGEIDVSTLENAPAGRLPVETRLAARESETKVCAFVRGQLDRGKQAYFVYPFVEDHEKNDLKSATSAFERLKNEEFEGYNVGLMHARLDEDEKRAAIKNFSLGKYDVLVATGVVEVGIDIPNATVMVVEGADRFGLSSLHQLRGRVGRGRDQGYCFFIYESPPTDAAKERLKILYESSDGFLIAERDLELRGPGEAGGMKQSGALRFKIANIVRDKAVFDRAQCDLERAMGESPTFMESPRIVKITALIASRDER